ncbi:2-amino-4-hydroxy-6-hydroxymethyldihydropteridine diphosphokinase [Ornithinimicrobium pratense]|uniref:Bifunctional folate synthesis protein n=1 Tax=Ornithinimicrobium pratense TaxID=2593973 RepID=A0A5J6V1U6_9MICO|nr:2-amino-4-hydroxy-6-hydroxymethyldihydropteridine diphosphokinase [Ornithinimicrobium pratense]QFG67618.1 2-amino-4-hydroxy-6-hydroxymethyldihydropteridine diphosphokinase [Ornithinimicrobium pratense]
MAYRADLIRLTGVRARGFHGVLAHERRDGQDFIVDVEMSVDLSRAGASDDLRHTVHYGEVAADVVAIVEGEPDDLIESLAEQIAKAVLARPLVEAVEVTVHKPQAPVGVPFSDVEVVVRRTKDVPVVIALGANLERDGEAPQATLRQAVRHLQRTRGLRAVRVSGLYATAPVGGELVAGQPDYVNAVALARTSLAPATLLARLHRIEADLGRTRDVRWGARTLDLDLVQYGDPRDGSDVASTDPDVLLPHPRAHQRAFVLVPWLDVDPEAALRTGEGVTPVAELIPRLTDQTVRELEGQR